VQVAAIAAMCVQTKASLIPIAKTTPAMSCSSTPLRPALQHVIFMGPQCGDDKASS
jgi:hypothetical protein